MFEVPSPKRRPFTLAHALALIGATAMGLAPMRAYLAVTPKTGLGRSVGAASLVLASWTVWFLVLHLIPPRDRLRRVARQPGAAACLAVTAWWVPHGALILVMVTTATKPSYWADVETIAQLFPMVGAPAVVASWLTLALTGAGRPEPTWRDRLGRAIGAGWLVLYLLEWLYVYLL